MLKSQKSIVKKASCDIFFFAMSNYQTSKVLDNILISHRKSIRLPDVLSDYFKTELIRHIS